MLHLAIARNCDLAMATLQRVLRLEEAILGSPAAGPLMKRVGHLEVCCWGSEATGPLQQRTTKLEEFLGEQNVEMVQEQAAPVENPADVADAAASSQVPDTQTNMDQLSIGSAWFRSD